MPNPSSSLQDFEEKRREFHSYLIRVNRIIVLFDARTPSTIYQPNTRTLNINIDESCWNPSAPVRAPHAIACIRRQSGGLGFTLSIIIGMLGAILSGIGNISSLGALGWVIASIIASLTAVIILGRLLNKCRRSTPMYFKEPLLEELVSRAAGILRECEKGGKCSGSTRIGSLSLNYIARMRRFRILKPRVEFMKIKSTWESSKRGA